MAQEAAPQWKRCFRPDVRLGAILGFPLGILFALVFYFGWGSSSPNVVTEQGHLLLDYGLLVLLLFFVIGVLRGRATGRKHSGVTIAVSACLSEAWTAALLNSVFSLVVRTSFGYLFGYAISPQVAGFLWGWWAVGVILLGGLLGVTGAALGESLGCRFLRRRPSQTRAGQC